LEFSQETWWYGAPPNLASHRIWVSAIPPLRRAVSHLAACLLTYSILKAWEPHCSPGSGQDRDAFGQEVEVGEQEGSPRRKTF